MPIKLILSLSVALFFPLEASWSADKTGMIPATNDCSDIDIRNQLPNNLAIRYALPYDQSGSFCASFVMSDLLSYELKESISPYDIAYATHSYSKEERAPDSGENSLLNGGPGVSDSNNILHALYKRNKGVCPFEKIPAARDTEREAWPAYGKMIQQIQEIKEQLKQIKNQEAVNEIVRSNCQLQIQNHITLPASTILQALDRNKEKSITDTIAALAEESCHGDHIPLPNDIVFMEYPKNKVSEIVDQKLAEGKPLGWSIHTSRIKKSGGGWHAVSIIGRKKFQEKCMYIVRNSWGNWCEGYKEPYRTNCDLRSGTFLVQKEDLNRWSKAGKFADGVYTLERTPHH